MLHVSTATPTMLAQSRARHERLERIRHRAENRAVPLPLPAVTAASLESPRFSSVSARFAFANFVAGASNALVHAAATQIINHGKGKRLNFNPLFVYGGVGFGKSHLLQGIAHSVGLLGRNALYLTAERFMFGFVKSEFTTVQERLNDVDVLLIDDAQFLQGGLTRTEFSNSIDLMVGSGRPVVVTSDCVPSDLGGLDERARARLTGGVVLEIKPFDEEHRLAVLKSLVEVARCDSPAFEVPPDALDFLARTFNGNGWELEGVINRLLAHSSLSDEAITREMVERVSRDIARPVERRPVRIDDIQRFIAQIYNIPRTELLSARRTANVVRPRQVAMYLAKVLTLRSLPEIGRRFGGRDHTTVLHAVRQIEKLRTTNIDIEQSIALVCRHLEVEVPK